MPLAPPVTTRRLGNSGFMVPSHLGLYEIRARHGVRPQPSALEHGLQLLRRERGSEVGIRRYRGVALRVEPLCAVRVREREDRRRFLVDGSLIGSYALAYRKAHV